MRRRIALGSALAALIALSFAVAQAQSPWPDPPGAAPPAAPPAKAPPAKAKKAVKKSAKKGPPADIPDSRFELEPGPQTPDSPNPDPNAPPAKGPPAAKKGPVQPPLNIKCDGPFSRDTSHDILAKAFGARNVVAKPGQGSSSTIIFPNDPRRRLEVTWRDATARRRPAMIVIEGASTWRARGFRIGETIAQVEKVNGKPFKLFGFSAEIGGSARDWLGGALDKLSGGCQLGMRFAIAPKASAEVRAKVTVSSDLTSDAADVRAAKPVILEMVIAYPE